MLHLKTQSANTQHISLHNPAISRYTGQYFTQVAQPGLDAWLITFSAVMILQHQNHCLLGVGRVQIGACFIRAQLREYLYQVALWTPKPLPGRS